MTDTITITGNVATAPDFKRTPNGVAITSFRLASTRRRFDRATSTWVDDGTNWYRVSIYRRLAEHAFHSLRLGERVLLTGRLRVRDWDNGTTRGTDVDIDADAIGHDLLWGTSTFQKSTASAAATAQDADWSTAPGDTRDAWSTPGVAPVYADAPSAQVDADAPGPLAPSARPAPDAPAGEDRTDHSAPMLVDAATPF